MIEITSFLLKHLYELMADDYSARHNDGVGAIRLLSGASEASLVSSTSLVVAEKRPKTTAPAAKKRESRQQQRKQQHSKRSPKHSQVDTSQASRSSSCSSSSSRSRSRSPSSSFRARARARDELEGKDYESGDDSSLEQILTGNSITNSNSNTNQCYLSERVSVAAANITHSSREQETNQQIVSFLANNHLPDLFCETFIELLFICVFLAVSWIFVMIVQLHCHQLQQPARLFYCNTKFLASLMYCNSKHHLAAS